MFYRTDVERNVFTQLKVRAKDAVRNEWETTKANEELKVVLNTSEVENWVNTEPILIARLNIDKLKNSDYTFTANDHIVRDENNKDSFEIKGKTVFLNVRYNYRDGSKFLIFPSSLNTIIPGVYEIIYKK